jgi:hypothetical protein
MIVDIFYFPVVTACCDVLINYLGRCALKEVWVNALRKLFGYFDFTHLDGICEITGQGFFWVFPSWMVNSQLMPKLVAVYKVAHCWLVQMNEVLVHGCMVGPWVCKFRT